MALSSLSLQPSFFSKIRNPNRIIASSKPNSFQNIQTLSPSIRTGIAILPVLSFEGEKIGETFLNLRIARPETARSVVHRGIVTFLRNRRRGTASTKGRGEVRGGGRKPYPQKGTGRARRGSQRTPLRRGGAVVFGPKPRDWTIKMNRKEKRLALATALWSAAEDSIVLEDFNSRFERPKTRDFLTAMKNWGVDPAKKSMFFLMEVSRNVRLCSRNINTLRMLTPTKFNLFDILNSDKLVYTQASVDYLNSMYPSKRTFKLKRPEIAAGGDDSGVKCNEEKENAVLDEAYENELEGDEYENEDGDYDEDGDDDDDENGDCDDEYYDEEGDHEDYDDEDDNEEAHHE